MDLYKELSHEERKYLLEEQFGYSIDDDGIVYDHDGNYIKLKKDEFGNVIGEFKTLSDFFEYQNRIGYKFGLSIGKLRLQLELRKLLFQ